MSSGASVEALDALTGDLLWSYEPGATFGFMFSSPDVVDRVVYVGLFDGYLNALSASTGEMLWRSAALESEDSAAYSLTVVDGVIYLGSISGHLYALDAPPVE